MSIENYFKIKNYLTAFAVFALIFSVCLVYAQENKVDYKGETIVDSDLDGLTDQAEIQTYNTDLHNPDTDGDGIMDGTEILKSTDPLDQNDPIISLDVINRETPWVWYVVRAAGIIGFVFLWITVFLGLAIRNPILKKIVEPIYSLDLHCFMAATAIFWALLHGTALLFDKAIDFKVQDIAIPFFSTTTFVNPNYMALGIMVFYAMVIMAITSYLRRHIKHWLWRVLHFLNPAAFIFVVMHGYVNGTDIKNFWIGSAFLFSTFILVVIYMISLVSAIINKIKAKNNLFISQENEIKN